METLSEVLIPLGSSSGISKLNMSSVIADGRNEDVCEQAVISGTTISISQLITASPRTSFKRPDVSSCLFFVCRSSLVKTRDCKVKLHLEQDKRRKRRNCLLQRKNHLFVFQSGLGIFLSNPVKSVY